MFCPFCSCEETKVNDSRIVSSGSEIRRRRECLVCESRFTTYERIDMIMPKVIKRSGYPTDFSEEKLRGGLLKALEKRPVSATEFEGLLARIVTAVRSLGDREIRSKQLGQIVMNELKLLDPVAYVRFASVYLSFDNMQAFKTLIEQYQEVENVDN
ncbi:MAG TPA: transcriptional regulator NrdR [Gammaproteobacteria bacterium]|nr:transcriptional regulator NrdR [Gammaproteobacteria bacterium]